VASRFAIPDGRRRREVSRVTRAARAAIALLGIAAASAACGPKEIVPSQVGPRLRLTSTGSQDSAPKEELRMVPAEAYMRTYLTLFGGLAPLEVQKRARGTDGAQLFDTWDDYFSSLGFPDYRIDMPRSQQTNALMVATFERLGVALCDRAVEHDLKAKPPMNERVVFAFDAPAGPLDKAGFEARFDVLHRTFLAYPAKLAPTDRTARFFKLYEDVHARHAKTPGKPRFSPDEAAWASVCYGLVRHPEFHLY
jgi:hypothetical protein